MTLQKHPLECIVGIDPGLTGGIGVLAPTGRIRASHEIKCNDKEIDYEWLASIIYRYKQLGALFFLERVHAMPKQGVSSMFKFGMTFGAIKGVLASHACAYELVTPQRWYTIVEQEGDTSKERSYKQAEELFGNQDVPRTPRSKKIPAGIADALLIAEYGRRTLIKQGTLTLPVV